MSNSFGNILKFHSFGESHGVALGCVIDKCPSGLEWKQEILDENLKRRRPGHHGKSNSIVSDRNEKDEVEVLSGVFEGKTLGTPIAMMVRNKDQRSKDYSEIKNQHRPGHADDTWKDKYQHVDYRGGGRSSGRETIARVMAGSVAEMMNLKLCPGLQVKVFTQKIHDIELTEEDLLTVDHSLNKPNFKELIDQYNSRMPHAEKSQKVEELLLEAKTAGKSYGGVAEIWIDNLPKGLGQPVFSKLKSDFAAAFLSVGATNSFELGDASFTQSSEGTEVHDSDVKTEANIYGGIRGGISTGHRIKMKIGFKPTASVMDVAKKGRHDPCILPRAVVVLESMAHFVIADQLLQKRLDNI